MKKLLLLITSLTFSALAETIEIEKAKTDINFNEIIVAGQKQRGQIRKEIETIVDIEKVEAINNANEVQEFIKIEMEHSRQESADQQRLKSELSTVPDEDVDDTFFEKDITRDPSSEDGSSDDEVAVEVSQFNH